ncbi:MAG: immunoglobulin domain-containing protein [Burkholderiaceae bacterium]|nr:immunoglobulin domain-containing protein [Burkholderiaceae bacterium]
MPAGSSATLAVAAEGTAPLRYQWFRNGTSVAGATLPALSFTAVQPGAAGSYTVEVSNAAGTVVSSAVAFDVDVAPPPVSPVISLQPQGATVAVGSTATIAVAANGTAPLAFQWLRDGVAIAGANAAVLSFSAAQPADSGVYEIIVSNAAGSVRSAGAVLTVTSPSAPQIPRPRHRRSASSRKG